MQTINGKLITEHPDNAAALQSKLEQIISKSEQLESYLAQQSQKIEELKLTVIVLENNLNSRDLERGKQIQLGQELLVHKISQKLLKVSVATVIGFLSIGILLLFNSQNTSSPKNTKVKSEIPEAIELILKA